MHSRRLHKWLNRTVGEFPGKFRDHLANRRRNTSLVAHDNHFFPLQRARTEHTTGRCDSAHPHTTRSPIWGSIPFRAPGASRPHVRPVPNIQHIFLLTSSVRLLSFCQPARNRVAPGAGRKGGPFSCSLLRSPKPALAARTTSHLPHLACFRPWCYKTPTVATSSQRAPRRALRHNRECGPRPPPTKQGQFWQTLGAWHALCHACVSLFRCLPV